MHVRIETMQMENLLRDIQSDIDRNLELVNDDNYPGASGYARGSLISFQIRLKSMLDCQSHEDPWDYANPD